MFPNMLKDRYVNESAAIVKYIHIVLQRCYNISLLYDNGQS